MAEPAKADRSDLDDPALEAAAKAMWEAERKVHTGMFPWEDTCEDTRAYQRHLAAVAVQAFVDAENGSPTTQGGDDA